MKEKFLNLDYQKEKLLKVFHNFDSEDKKKLIRALDLAEKAHQGQKRHGDAPYIIHPIRAALILIEIAESRNVDLICAILLHDVLEDTDIKEELIENQFGKEVLRLVEIVTRRRSKDETEEENVEGKNEKVKLITKSDKGARLIKLCDRLDNKYSQEFLPENHPAREKFDRWNKEFEQYIPIAKITNDNLFRIFENLK